MMFLFTLLVVLPLLGTLRADQDGVAELERRSNGDVDRVQNDIPGMQRREDNPDDYLVRCTNVYLDDMEEDDEGRYVICRGKRSLSEGEGEILSEGLSGAESGG
ncbi:UNVERIFIED_CONTAM: hypothetical protein K2H54_004516 [Gekko kuhli]